MKKEEIFNVLNKFDKFKRCSRPNIIPGDFNFVDFDNDKGKKRVVRNIQSGKNSFRNARWWIHLECNVRTRKFIHFSPPKERGEETWYFRSIKYLKYTSTLFQTAHKIMSFQLQGEEEIVPSWKMNSSVLKDSRYQMEIEDIFNKLNDLNIQNQNDWWNMFITVLKGTTVAYTKQKARIRYPSKNICEL